LGGEIAHRSLEFVPGAFDCPGIPRRDGLSKVCQQLRKFVQEQRHHLFQQFDVPFFEVGALGPRGQPVGSRAGLGVLEKEIKRLKSAITNLSELEVRA
jgi:hypothetical protein